MKSQDKTTDYLVQELERLINEETRSDDDTEYRTKRIQEMTELLKLLDEREKREHEQRLAEIRLESENLQRENTLLLAERKNANEWTIEKYKAKSNERCERSRLISNIIGPIAAAMITLVGTVFTIRQVAEVQRQDEYIPDDSVKLVNQTRNLFKR